MMRKIFVNAEQLLESSYRLGLAVWESGFHPSVVIGVWRGGTPVAIAVHELLVYLGVAADHFPIRTRSYTGIAERGDEVQISGLEPIAERIGDDDRVLLVDDVFDTGLSLQATLRALERICGPALASRVRIATAYYKPGNNRTGRAPDFHVHETEHWLVFPHELKGLSAHEILANKPAARVLADVLRRKQGA